VSANILYACDATAGREVLWAARIHCFVDQQLTQFQSDPLYVRKPMKHHVKLKTNLNAHKKIQWNHDTKDNILMHLLLFSMYPFTHLESHFPAPLRLHPLSRWHLEWHSTTSRRYSIQCINYLTCTKQPRHDE